MEKALRDAPRQKIGDEFLMQAWKEIVCGVGLAIAAQPIHEGGHAIATRLLTGVWPQITFWAVYPVGHFESELAALTVLAAGDVAIVGWWMAIFGVVRHRPERKWMLVGPTFVVAIALLNWIAAGVFASFGYGDVGASDAGKFLSISGVAPWAMTAVLMAVVTVMTIVAMRYFWTPQQRSPAA